MEEGAILLRTASQEHLAELLVPVMDLDHSQILELLNDPHGQLRQHQPWTNPQGKVAVLLKDRL